MRVLIFLTIVVLTIHSASAEIQLEDNQLYCDEGVWKRTCPPLAVLTGDASFTIKTAFNDAFTNLNSPEAIALIAQVTDGIKAAMLSRAGLEVKVTVTGFTPAESNGRRKKRQASGTVVHFTIEFTTTADRAENYAMHHENFVGFLDTVIGLWSFFNEDKLPIVAGSFTVSSADAELVHVDGSGDTDADMKTESSGDHMEGAGAYRVAPAGGVKPPTWG